MILLNILIKIFEINEDTVCLNDVFGDPHYSQYKMCKIGTKVVTCKNKNLKYNLIN